MNKRNKSIKHWALEEKNSRILTNIHSIGLNCTNRSCLLCDGILGSHPLWKSYVSKVPGIACDFILY